MRVGSEMLAYSPTRTEMSRAIGQALAQGFWRPGDTALLLHDLDRLAARGREILAAFPDSCLHTVAVKANPLPPLLAVLRDLGFGAEAASLPELVLALKCGFAPEKIAFDSPAKTREEIAYALSRGVRLNCDNLDEAARVAEILDGRAPEAPIGLRVNPQVGLGAVAMSSTAGAYSKFGAPLAEEREAILQAFARWPFLTGLHLHVGSQGCGQDLLVSGVGRVFALARDIEARAGRALTALDIGGGLPFPYLANAAPVDPGAYAQALARECPGMFERYGVVTEFGRFLQAGAGFAASRVEYVKRQGDIRTAVLHLGADLMPRECLRPGEWPHVFAAFGPEGAPLAGPEGVVQLAGPLCFSGDFCARDVRLPELAPGDILAVRDAGAYTLSMWSRYNSRAMPRVLGYRERDGGLEFAVLKERESVERVLEFWR